MTTRVYITILALVVLFALAPSTWSQVIARPGFMHGNWEFTLSGSGSSDKNFDTTTLSAEGSIGYFMSDRLAMVLRQGIGVANTRSDTDWNGSTRVALDYHFGGVPFYPFIGANLGYLYGDQTVNTFIAGPEAGVKFFVSDQTFLFGLIEYQVLFRSTSDVEDAFNDGRWAYSLGMGFRW